MTNCSAHQREKKEEITLFIEGWPLIKPTGSGSCLLQHLSNRKHYKSLKQLPCPSSAQGSCFQGDKKLNSQSSYLLQVPLPSFKEDEIPWIYPEFKAAHLLPQRTAPGKGKAHRAAQQKEHTSHPSECTPSALRVCGCCQLSPSTAWMVPGLANSCLLRWSLLPSLIAAERRLQYQQSSTFLIHSILFSPVYAPTSA